MSDTPNGVLQVAGSAVMAGVAGFIGMLVGVKVHGSEIENIKERLTRMERKQDALLNHFAIKGIEGED